MNELIVVIEKTSDHYSAYSENIDGIYAGGDSVEEVKKNILNAIKLVKEEYNEKDIPGLLKGDYNIIYKNDIPSFLNYYSKTLSLAGLERITGINQGQLSHYLNGTKKPRKETTERIGTALHKFAKELSQVRFI